MDIPIKTGLIETDLCGTVIEIVLHEDGLEKSIAAGHLTKTQAQELVDDLTDKISRMP